MIAALLMGRKGSIAFPEKNLYPVLGRHLVEYPLLAAKNSKKINHIYITTDSERIVEIGKKYGAEIIDRPPELCTAEALGEDVFAHGYDVIKKKALEKGKKVDIVVLLLANAPTVTSEMIDRGIEILVKNPEYDSAVSVSKYNMWSPLRARKIGSDGLLHPFVPFETFGDPDELSCDRDSQGDVWYADMGVSIVRSRCLENIEEGLLPQKWMGQKIYPLKQWGGLDVDYDWQIPGVEYWLREHGFVKGPTTYEE
jgi:hypothetical protein